MAMYQGPQRVCLEFLKSSAGIGKGRIIKLNYTQQQIPPQLYGRVDEVSLACMCKSPVLERSDDPNIC